MENEDLFMELADIPMGWEPLAECGFDRDEAVALCVRIKSSGRDACVVVQDGWHTVWEVAFRSWPYA